MQNDADERFVKSDIQIRRSNWHNDNQSNPQHLFLSLDAHACLLAELKFGSDGVLPGTCTSLVGMRLYDMLIHVVPSLQEGFEIA